jgi:hypothetical protein
MSSAVDDAIARAADNSPTGNLRGTQAIADRAVLAAEVKRLRRIVGLADPEAVARLEAALRQVADSVTREVLDEAHET